MVDTNTGMFSSFFTAKLGGFVYMEEPLLPLCSVLFGCFYVIESSLFTNLTGVLFNADPDPQGSLGYGNNC